MQRPLLSKVAILMALFLLFSCKKKADGIIGSWEVRTITFKESKDSVPAAQLKGFTYDFNKNGSFLQSLPDGQRIPGKYTLKSDTLLLMDTVRNVSYAHFIKTLEKDALTITLFNSFFNDEMELKMKRVKKKE